MNNFIYQLIDGKANKSYTKEELLHSGMVTGESKNYTLERAMGLCVPRAELDEQPVLLDFLGPMYGGTRLINDVEHVVIRYETQKVYDMLSSDY